MSAARRPGCAGVLWTARASCGPPYLPKRFEGANLSDPMVIVKLIEKVSDDS
jgi:hypothetical protein